MVEAVYFFGDKARWNLGWSNPNQAGAFVACLIPWLWAFAGYSLGAHRPAWRQPFFCAILLTELILWVLLCKTYSRGALVAILGAPFAFGVLYVIILVMRPNARDAAAALKWRRDSSLFAVRAASIAVILFTTGFFDRISPEFLSQDASAGNRITLWKGGTQMVVASPWNGWGVGQSGSHFMHWFQPLDETTRYAGMVNSYLHIAVERGLPFLALAVATLLTLVTLGIFAWLRYPSSRLSPFIVTASLSISVFLLANVFSTLWLTTHLWWVPLAAGAFVFVATATTSRGEFRTMAKQAALLATIAAFVLTSSVYVCGTLLEEESHISFAKTGVWLSNERARETGSEILILPDRKVLGADYGKAIRRLFNNCDVPIRGFVPFQFADWKSSIGNNRARVIAFGQAANKSPHCLKKGDHLTLVHPLGRPGDWEIANEVVVFLPSIASGAKSRQWKRLAAAKGWTIHVNEGTGTDIQHIWPECYLRTL